MSSPPGINFNDAALGKLGVAKVSSTNLETSLSKKEDLSEIMKRKHHCGATVRQDHS